MPRQARLDIPGLLQHVIVRGIERSDIFFDDQDRDNFVERLGCLIEDTETDCFAWVLMSNHVHLLLRCNRNPLSRFMRRLLTGYAVSFNIRHKRAGYLFQNRYKSIVCEEEPYFLELVRYIHLNPLRAGLVASLTELDAFPWCGHSTLVGKKNRYWQNMEEVLSRFALKSTEARQRYHIFVEDGLSMGKREDLVGGGLSRSQGDNLLKEEAEDFDDRILGSGAFVKAVLGEDARIWWAQRNMSLDDLARSVTRKFKLKETDLQKRGRQNNRTRARSLFCYLAVSKLHKKGCDLGLFLGIGASSVSRAVKRGEELFRKDKQFQEWWEMALKQ